MGARRPASSSEAASSLLAEPAEVGGGDIGEVVVPQPLLDLDLAEHFLAGLPIDLGHGLDAGNQDVLAGLGAPVDRVAALVVADAAGGGHEDRVLKGPSLGEGAFLGGQSPQ